jgi:Lignostilbene-alpha,beta-dioxygenase and related enzymes
MNPSNDLQSIPQLNGIFAPIHQELDDTACQVIQGAIPDDLSGTYLRNGPNPRFPPIGSYTYPLDGDGMVHAVRFKGGRAHYRNRFVRTPSLAAEERAGRALWGGVLTPIPPPADLVGPELAQKPFRDMPDINVVRHGGQLLALSEGDPPFTLSDQLATIGPWDFGGGLPLGIGAHPKIDPATGEMVVFRYGIEDPLLSWAVVGADGTVTRAAAPIAIDAPYMIHDCAITARHLVLLVCPLRFDFTSPKILAWEPERGTRIAVIRRDRATAPVRWFETGAFWVWHIANAWETANGGGERIVLHYPFWSHPGLLQGESATGGVHRMTLRLDAGGVAVDVIDDRPCEFPRIDDRRTGLPCRYFHTGGKDPNVPPEPGVWTALLRFDLQTGQVAERRSGRVALGEAVFAPARGADPSDENGGYLLVYACDAETLETTLLILDPLRIDDAPLATLRMPQRVPLGLHGTWVPKV